MKYKTVTQYTHRAGRLITTVMLLMHVAGVGATVEMYRDKRLALVIGNAEYPKMSRLTPLKNSVNDAKAVAQTLTDLGFEVELLIDKSRIEFRRALGDFEERLSRQHGGVALVYYTGHGMAGDDGRNYLMPVDAVVEYQEDVAENGISLERLMNDLTDFAKPQLSIFIVDACRNGVELQSRRQPTKGSRKAVMGDIQNPRGSLAAFATGPGQYALDYNADSDAHSPFATALLENLRQPYPLEKLFKETRNRVNQLTGGAQVPETRDSSLGGDFYFSPPQDPNPVTSATAPPAAVTAADTKANLKAQALESRETSPKATSSPTGHELESPATASGTPTGEKSPARFTEPEMVRLPTGIKMGKYEVTQGQWKAVMGDNPSFFKDCGDDCPVERVSWDEVQAFIKKMNAKTGKHYRLPSESEWETACLARENTEYCGSNDADAVAWYQENSGGKTHEVGQKQANAWGLHDMSGNVWELLQDCWHFYDCSDRVMRGGYWDNKSANIRSTFRIAYPATLNIIMYVGFRLAQD